MSEEIVERAVQDWDPLLPETACDYAKAFSTLRGECPVAWTDAMGGFWSVTKFKDILEVVRHPEIFSSAEQFAVPSLDLGIPWLPLQSNPPDHAAYRAPLLPFLAKRRVAEFEPTIRTEAKNLLEALQGRTSFNFVSEFSEPFAGYALCAVFDFPKEFWPRFMRWNADIMKAFPTQDAELLQSVIGDIGSYVAEEMDKRAGAKTDDFMGQLLDADINGRKLDHTDIVGYFLLLMSAGHDTSSNTLGNTIVHLARNPEHRQQVIDDPSLIPTAVEEIIRFYAPVTALGRRVVQDTELHGRQLKSGDQLAIVWASGSRDEDRVPDPDEFKLDRKTSKHLSFGLGNHLCVGADLGRLQVSIAIEEFLKKFQSFEIAGDLELVGWPRNAYTEIPLNAIVR